MFNLSRAVRGFRDGSAMRDAHAVMATPLTESELKVMVPSIYAESAHESRSSRYVYISTAEMLEGLAKEGFLPFDAKQAKCRDDGQKAFTKHLIRFRHESTAVQSYKASDPNKPIPEVVIVNSHNGTSSYQMYGGLFRALCLNGLIVSDGHVEEVRVPHKGNILDNVVEGAYRVLDNVTKAIGVHEEWSGVALADKERLFFAEAAHEIRFGEPETDKATGKVEPASHIPATALLRARRSEDQKSDLWTVFNRVQENAIKGGLHGTNPSHRDEDGKYHPARRVSSKHVAGIDQDVKLNRALWALAAKMAELKQNTPLASEKAQAA